MSTKSLPVIPYKDYVTDLAGLKNTLDTYGVAVLPDVLDTKECESLRDKAWSEFETLTLGRLKRSDPSTWNDIYSLFPLHSMLIQYFGVGHMGWIWDIRQHAKVREAFGTIHNDNDLLVSIDGASFHMPPEVTDRGWFRGNTWFHTDQSSAKDDYCIQGLVNLYPVNEGDATLAVYEKSHLHHAEFFKHFETESKEDWFKLSKPAHEQFFIDKGCARSAVVAPEGSLVLWNSKTFHQGIESMPWRTSPNHRLVAYVCMTPRAWAREADLAKKRTAFEEGRLTTHWPHRVKLFPKTPRTYGKEIPETAPVTPPTLTDVGRRLVGY